MISVFKDLDVFFQTTPKQYHSFKNFNLLIYSNFLPEK